MAERTITSSSRDKPTEEELRARTRFTVATALGALTLGLPFAAAPAAAATDSVDEVALGQSALERNLVGTGG